MWWFHGQEPNHFGALPCWESSVLIPSPNVAEDHQTKNAKALSERNAALLIPDSVINEKLFPEIFSLIKDEEKCRQLAKNIKQLAKPYATMANC